MALLQMSSVEEAAEALVVRPFIIYYRHVQEIDDLLT